MTRRPAPVRVATQPGQPSYFLVRPKTVHEHDGFALAFVQKGDLHSVTGKHSMAIWPHLRESQNTPGAGSWRRFARNPRDPRHRAATSVWCHRNRNAHAAVGEQPGMTDEVVPHFQNDPGVAVIEIGAKKFMCVGATPPYDHPHVFSTWARTPSRLPLLLDPLRLQSKLAADAASPAQCACTTSSPEARSE